MLKLAALLFNSLALLIYQLFFVDAITITQKIPPSGKPDTEFVVELTIVKGATTGFAKLQQDLPEGFTAVQEENSGATFTFSNQSVKFIWMSLPTDQEFKIKYKVKIAAGISGDKIIAGKFSYVSDNVKQTIDITPSTISVSNNDAPAASNPVSTTPAIIEPEQNTLPPTVGNESVSCVRKAPSSVTANFTVEITVKKGNITGFAKLLDNLPPGFTATVGNSRGAAFTFTDQKVKFVWVSMPVVSEFTVTYNVALLPTVNGNQTINGSYSFIENDETKKIIIPANTIFVSATDNTLAVISKDTVIPTTLAIVEKTQKIPETVVVETITTATTVNAEALSAKVIPTPQGDVNYRIQIAALRRVIEAKKLSDRYHLDQTVNTEMAQGLTKYTVGLHSEYIKARNARETVKSKGVVGPFVTAYNTGKRITVQEALMITSQKWYK